MGNNEVIIDGCNVAECPFYQYQTPDDYKMKYPESGDCEIGMAGFLFDYDRINEELEKACISNHNCHFKQLQRAKTELEQYKKSKQVSYEAMQKEWNKAVNELRDIKAENEKLKKALEEIREIAKLHQYFNPELLEIKGNIGQMQDLKMTEIYEKCKEILGE